MSGVEVGSKRSNDSYDDRSNKRQRGDRDRMRFLLVGKNCGSIIGKGGENIKRLRNEFNVRMHLPDSNSRDRVLAMEGNKGDCVSVLRELLGNCKEAPFPVDPKHKLNFEINFLAGSDQVGAVIGKGGEKIKEIREQSGGKVKVYQECLPNSNERVVAIGGDDETTLLSAFNIVIDLLADRPPKQQIIFYDPKSKNMMNDMPRERNDMSRGRNDMHDRDGPPMGGNQMGGNQMSGGGNPLAAAGLGNGLARALGGLGNLSNIAGATTLLNQLGLNPQLSAAILAGGLGNLQGNLQGNDQNREPMFNNNNNNVDNRVSNINDFGPTQRPDHGFERNQQNNNNNNNNHNNNNRGGGNEDRYGSNSNRDDRYDDNRGKQNEGVLSQMKTEVSITVPSDLCGAIIGRSGQRIKDIKYQSGARLDFSKTEKNSKEDRVLTISGTQAQTMAAQRMIADCLENRND